jgi:hypothetical protein
MEFAKLSLQEGAQIDTLAIAWIAKVNELMQESF